MSLGKFDMNLENYKCNDLENLFDLTFPYNNQQIDTHRDNLLSVLSNNKTIDKTRYAELNKFLNGASQKLKIDNKNGMCLDHNSLSQNGHNGSPFVQHDSVAILDSDSSMITKSPTSTNLKVTTHSSTGKSASDLTAPKGILNPINTHTLTQLLNIDSQFRPNYYNTLSTDFLFTLPTKLERVTSMTLQSATLPISWNGLSESRKNNKFRLRVALPKKLIVFGYDYFYNNAPELDDLDAANLKEHDIIIKIPDGNYNSHGVGDYSITTIINDIICHTLKVPLEYPRIAFKEDIKTNRSIFYEQSVNYDIDENCKHVNLIPYPWNENLQADPDPVQFKKSTHCENHHKVSRYTCYPLIRLLGIDFNIDANNPEYNDYNSPLQYTLGWSLGFRNAICDGAVTIDDVNNLNGLTSKPKNYIKHAIENKNVFTSQGILLLRGPMYGYIIIKDYHNSSNNGFIQAYGDSLFPSGDVISKVSLQGDNHQFGTIVTILGTTTTRTYFGPVDISRLHFQLLDEYGRVIDLNNMDWSLTLSFTCVYDAA